MESDRLLELARECARKVIENEIWAIKAAEAPTMHVFQDLCTQVAGETVLDETARDQLWDAVCEELADVEITYLFEGETARDRRRLRLEEEIAQTGETVLGLQARLTTLQRRLDRMDDAGAEEPLQ